MARQFRFSLLIVTLLTSCRPIGSPPASLDVSNLQTRAVATVFAGLTATALHHPTPASTPTASPTPGAMSTPTPPPPDFAQARILAVQNTPGVKLIVTLYVPGLSRTSEEFRGRIEQYDYACIRSVQVEDALECSGHPLPPFTRWDFLLLSAQGGEALARLGFTTPALPGPPTLADYQANPYCEVEPLYQPDNPEVIWAQDPSKEGCYAITCERYDRSGACGTPDTCVSMPEQPCP